MIKLIILDRDGVINQDSDDYIKTAAEWTPIPGSIDAIVRLSRAGYKIVIASNQSGIGRGFFDHAALNAMHSKLKNLLLAYNVQIDGIFYCPHTPDDNCRCRKPAAGLLDDISNTLGTNLERVPLIGDSLRDLQAGLIHRCNLILVRTGKGANTETKLIKEKNPILQNVKIFDDLACAAHYLCNLK